MEDTTFELLPALTAGIVAACISLIAVIVSLAVAPVRFPLNPLYLVGSAFSIETTTAYAWGFGTILSVGAAYGIFVSAVFSGFEVTALEPLWGAVAGLVLSIVTGTTLSYVRSLNRAVRAGQIGDPGPFLVAYGRWSAAQLVVTHLLFGLVVAVVYAELT